MTFPLARSTDDRVVAGVCAGIAERLGVDPTLVRLVFALLALAGGAGVILYLALWLATKRPRRPLFAIALVLVAGSFALLAFGLSPAAVAALALVAGGLFLMWRQGGRASLRPDAPYSLAGLVLVSAGAALLLTRGESGFAFLAPGAVAGALMMIVGPWLWVTASERLDERAARIRADERADVAARVHDSVLQTLALVQKHADDPRRVTSLARRQERELREWLYGDPARADGETFVSALAAAAQEVEDLHGVRIDVASAGDSGLDDDVRALVLAAREAMANAAKFSGTDEIAVYAEADGGRVAVFVRDRGAGFDRASVAADRRGISESIEGRMARAGGSAVVTSAPGAGTEVELVLPRDAT